MYLLKRVRKAIECLPEDKKSHLIVGLALSTLIPFLGILFGHYGALLALLIGTGANVWKELWYDRIQNEGTAEWGDFIATELPIILMYISFLL